MHGTGCVMSVGNPKANVYRLPYQYCTMCNVCWISNNRSGVASISTDIFRSVPIR